MIFLDTNVISETLNIVPTPHVEAWLARHDAELALSSIVIAEIAFGIHKIRPDERAKRLEIGLRIWRQRLAGRILAFTEEAALIYGEIMGKAARQGIRISIADGMIAAVALVNGGRLASRNLGDFRTRESASSIRGMRNLPVAMMVHQEKRRRDGSRRL